MRKFTALLAAGLVLGMSGMAMAAADATASADVTATVLTPITILKTADLNFGSFAVDAANLGTVVVSPLAARSVTGGVSKVIAGDASVTAATFTVSGENNATYSISLPASVTVVNGGDNMVANTFVSSPTVGAGGTLSGAGSENITVGGTLNVAAAQAPGVYTLAGGLTVTVAYN